MNHGFVIPSVGGETFFFSLRFLTWFRLFPFYGRAPLTPILPCCDISFPPLLFLFLCGVVILWDWLYGMAPFYLGGGEVAEPF